MPRDDFRDHTYMFVPEIALRSVPFREIDHWTTTIKQKGVVGTCILLV